MSAAFAVLPYVWAFAQNGPIQGIPIQSGPIQSVPIQSVPFLIHPPVKPPSPPRPNLAFYRMYTHAMLRRYARRSSEAGRVPSLLGQEMFRSKVTHYRVESFDDVVNDLETRDQMEELQMQTELLKAGVLTIDEVREMRGLPKLAPSTVTTSTAVSQEVA